MFDYSVAFIGGTEANIREEPILNNEGRHLWETCANFAPAFIIGTGMKEEAGSNLALRQGSRLQPPNQGNKRLPTPSLHQWVKDYHWSERSIGRLLQDLTAVVVRNFLEMSSLNLFISSVYICYHHPLVSVALLALWCLTPCVFTGSNYILSQSLFPRLNKITSSSLLLNYEPPFPFLALNFPTTLSL